MIELTMAPSYTGLGLGQSGKMAMPALVGHLGHIRRSVPRFRSVWRGVRLFLLAGSAFGVFLHCRRKRDHPSISRVLILQSHSAEQTAPGESRHTYSATLLAS